MKLSEVFKATNIDDTVKQLLTNEAKNSILDWIDKQGLPYVREFANKWIEQLTEQAANETGWAKIRDAVYFPVVIKVALWFIETCTTKVVEESIKKV